MSDVEWSIIVIVLVIVIVILVKDWRPESPPPHIRDDCDYKRD